jgi:phosphatidylserine decarboxylase
VSAKDGTSILSFGERIVRSAWRLTPQRAVSQVIGWSATRALPASVRAPFLRSFARQYGIAVEEAEKPIEEYSGLQEFFTRRLRPGARPIAAADGLVVAPADGTVVETGVVEAGLLLDAKDAGFTLADLLADGEAARRLDGGPYQVIYLSPRDYHRVHSPIEGRVVGWHYVPGHLFPVNARSVLREPGLFSKNERLVIFIDSPAGLAVVVMVAAVGVGHITAAYDEEIATHSRAFAGKEVRRKTLTAPIPITRGGELGTFNLGSTTIMFFEPHRVVLDPIAPGTAVRMGTSIGRVLHKLSTSTRADLGGWPG